MERGKLVEERQQPRAGAARIAELDAEVAALRAQLEAALKDSGNKSGEQLLQQHAAS